MNLLTAFSEYPNQNALLDAVNHSITVAEYEEAKVSLRHIALHETLEKTLKDNDVNVILGPSDGPLSSIAASAGKHHRLHLYMIWLIMVLGAPIATMPLGCLNLNGRPFGLSVMALPHQEDVLFKVMSAFESTFPKRVLPSLLVHAENSASL